MNEATVIFPHQLFEEHPALRQGRLVYLVEDAHFFTRLRFHKQKLMFHKATLIEYAQWLTKKGYTVTVVALEDNLFKFLHRDRISHIHCTLLYDHTIEKSLTLSCREERIVITFHESPYFMTSQDRFKEYFASKKTYFFTAFYKTQREHFNILMTKDGKPQGGSLSFDPENRRKLPPSMHIPIIEPAPIHRSIHTAHTWVQQFKNNPGSHVLCTYPVTFADAKAWFRSFLEHRLHHFGTYQDALSKEHSVLFHSVLSPLLNVGLLTPHYVIEETIEYALNHEMPLNSLEGFIRQIIGWREFVYGVYLFHGIHQERSNYFDHRHKLPGSFWTATTGIEPVDMTLNRVLETGYAHHIERLMLFGNFMLLCEIDPQEVYRWFMELYIDSYDWVMIPNIYGMSQFADGGLMTTKPYISGSNYLKKMSNYPKGIWEDIWDHLYWRFIAKNHMKLSTIHRMRPMLFLLKSADSRTIKKHIQGAEDFLKVFLKDSYD